MEKLRIEKIRAAWDEFGSVLQQVEHSGTLSTLDAELLKSKLLATYEALTLPVESKSGITQPVVPDQIQAIKDEDSKPVSLPHTHEEKTGKKEVPSGKNIAAKEEQSTIETPKQEPLKEATHAKIQEIPAKESSDGNRTGEVIGEKLRSSRKFVHDELAEKVQAGRQDLSSALQAKPIENIEKAIGINDKFLYIKELFRNNGQLYKETVEKLDAFQNLDEALRHLQEGFNWDEKDPVVQKFKEIVRRRHQ